MKAKSDGFPLPVRRGSATVKIYRERKSSGDYFRVSFYKGTVRHGLNFSDLDAARREAEAKAAQLSRGDIEAMAVTGRDRLVYARAFEAIGPLDVALDSAVLEYSEAKAVLDGHSLSEAARFYMRQHSDDGDALQRIEETSTPIIIGTTFNNCRFHGLETRDGMRRRVLYYVSDAFARTIYWPPCRSRRAGKPRARDRC